MIQCNASKCHRLATQGVLCKSPTGSECNPQYALCDHHAREIIAKSSPGECWEVPLEDIG